MEWSIDGQTPEFLAATRMISLDDSVLDIIMPKMSISPGHHVLDVGCGSGEYCFRLGSRTNNVEFTGLDCDKRFIDFATRRAQGKVGYPFESPNPFNSYCFVCGDGRCLPFDDGAFDRVVSHTYLTAVSDWENALAEMHRVCKPGGIVSSVTSMTDNFYGTGSIELFAGASDIEDSTLLQRVATTKAALFDAIDLIGGIPPRAVPSAFVRTGFEHVSCLPVGQYFCLSDDEIADEQYLRHVELLRLVELEELARLEHNPQRPAYLSQKDLACYESLIERRADQLRSLAGSNREWNWYGNAALAVYGVKSDN